MGLQPKVLHLPEPFLDLEESPEFQGVQPMVAAHGDRHQSGVPERDELLGDVFRGDTQDVGEYPGWELTVGREDLDDSSAGGMGEGGEFVHAGVSLLAS